MPEYQGPERRRRPREEQRTEKVETYLRPVEAEKLRETCEREGVSVSHIMRQLCRQYLRSKGITAI
jgi:hypothetical protein